MEYSPMEHAHRLMQVYEEKSRQVSREFGFSQTAFDILMFLANNPEYHTARDIVQVRLIRANLVSVNVEKLVEEGYLVRTRIPGDRRKVGLYLTEKADPVIERGRAFQQGFFADLAKGISDEDLECLRRMLEKAEENLENMTGQEDIL